MNNITIEFCTEDRARLDKLLAALEAVAQSQAGNAITQAAEAVATAAQAVEKPEGTVAAETAPEEQEKPAGVNPEPEAKPDVAPAVSRSEVQQKVVSLCSAGKKAEVKEIVKKYAGNVSGIPEDKLQEVFEALTKLEG